MHLTKGKQEGIYGEAQYSAHVGLRIGGSNLDVYSGTIILHRNLSVNLIIDTRANPCELL